MKKVLVFFSVLALGLLTSCNKQVPTPDELNCNPSPLTVVGGKVNAEITGTFPAKKFVKKGVLEVTPVLKYGDQEIVGETVTYVGEKAKVNGTVVNYKNGGTYSQKFTCPYNDKMNRCELFLRFHATSGKKTYDVPDLKVADGVNATATLAKAEDNVLAVTPDKYQRIIQAMQEADIKFLIQQSNLRDSETKSQAIKDLQAAIKDADQDERKLISSLEVLGYASPDGATKLNENLAENRQKVAQQYLAKQLKKDKVKVDILSDITAEDWEGFKKLMENSNIQDKELVLRVLSMYSDPEEREAQIKNLAAVYKNIADDILPELRRSRLVLTTDLIGRSDDEIKQAMAEDPSVLSVEEMLYAATLTSDLNEQAAIYKQVTERFPNDLRGWNNLGIVNFKQGNVDSARRLYAKALAIDANNPDVNYNAAVAAMAQGDTEKAGEYLGKAAGTTGNLEAAMGTYYTMTGDYQKAKGAYGKTNTNNAAIQQILNEDYAGARQTLANIAEPNATTYYLQAVVAARTNNRDGVYAALRQAVAADAAMKAKAAQDIEFAKYAEDATFLGIVK
ncbi:MAG: tetratricopeptide repeat protein [Paludibacteraceae bacterium]|nr:tetratricopeptide repeat protein [Paludibacteraceae bacterium]